MIAHDTIAAIATPLIPSAIGIVRVSGPQTKAVIQTLFKVNPHQLVPRNMVTKTAYLPNGKILDDCCFVFYKGPKSYTGEDVLEIFCHGSLYILNECLQRIISEPGCRLAKNGEFTQRAFLNGKLSLSKAESVLDIIESNSSASHDIALNQYQGHVFQTVSKIREMAMTILEGIEASLEFPDDVGAIDPLKVHQDCRALMAEITPIIESSDYGAYVKRGITYLIVGQPNVGKSSLLNALSGESRSIVSDSAGTTRDYIEICIQYKGVLITLIDTAGIRKTSDAIEQMGIEKIKSLSKSCDGIVMMDDGQSHDFPDCPSFIVANKPIIYVKNKCDQNPKNKRFANDALAVSCKTGEGLQNLKDRLVTTFMDPRQYQPQLMLCNARQIAALRGAFHHIKVVQELCSAQATLDIVSIELRDAIHRLSDILGDQFTEELLDGIFSKFCIGK